MATVSPTPVTSAAGPAVTMLAIRAALPVLLWLMWRVLPTVSSETFETMHIVIEAVRGLLGLAALIVFWVWFARAYDYIRATRGPTRYTTGLAIGSWFIPFANLVLPYLAIRDAWRRGANDENGERMLGWWLMYLLTTSLTIFHVLLGGSRGLAGQLISDRGTAEIVFPILGWASIISQILAYGGLLWIVQTLTRRLSQ